MGMGDGGIHRLGIHPSSLFSFCSQILYLFVFPLLTTFCIPSTTHQQVTGSPLLLDWPPDRIVEMESIEKCISCVHRHRH